MIHTSLHKYEQQGKSSLHVRQIWWIMTISKANIVQMTSNFAHGCTMAWQWIFTLGVTEVVEKKWWFCNLLWIGGIFCKGGAKVTLQNFKTIDSHKVYHIRVANQLLVECESSIPSPSDMGKPTLTILRQSLTGAVEIQKQIQKLWNIGILLLFHT